MIAITGIRKKEMADEARIDPTTPGWEGPTGPSQPLITESPTVYSAERAHTGSQSCGS
jgi:hypothetical protein